MLIRTICRRIVRRFKKKRPRKTTIKLHKPRPRHEADTPLSNGACLLLGLPAEIRHRILEYTLCREEPIQARHNFALPSYDSIVSYFPLAPIEFDEWPMGKPRLAVLRTCRQLYREGSEIFYSKNVFSITICDPGYGCFGNVDMLGMGSPEAVFMTHPRLKTCPNLKIHLLFGAMVCCAGLSYGTNKDSLDEAIEDIYRSWQGRGSLEVEVYQKWKQWLDHPIGGPALLYKLGLFRCQSATFRGLPQSMAFRLTKVVESDEPVIDLQEAYRQLDVFLNTTYTQGTAYDTVYGQAHADAERFAVQHDVENFILMRNATIEGAVKRLEMATKGVQDEGLRLTNETLPLRIKVYPDEPTATVT